MKLSAILNVLDSFAPLSIQEKWDNSGLQIGLPDGNGEVNGVMICLDVTKAIVDEAVERGCNLIVSHHPLIFKGFKHITDSTPQESAAAAAIRAGVAVYSSHTSLDSTVGGISYAMAQRLGAEVKGVISPSDVEFFNIRVTCPRRLSADVRLVLLGHEPGCTYTDIEGESMAAGGEFDPARGFDIHHEPLTAVDVEVDSLHLNAVLQSLSGMPDYSRMTVNVAPLTRRNSEYGLGVYATLPDGGMTGKDFVEALHSIFGTPVIKASAAYRPDMKIKRIALCGGSAAEFITKASAAGADAYVTGDTRYHDLADATDMDMAVFDIGHFESENCAKDIFYHLITKNFANFAVYKSEKETNPVKYI